jgi:hypothetical protein
MQKDRPCSSSESTPARTVHEKRLLMLSVALGVLVLATVPLHAVLRADPSVLSDEDYLEPACRTPVHVFPEPICPRVVAGESPLTIVFALGAVPLALRRGGRRTMKALAVTSLALAVLQLVSPFAFTFESTAPGAGTPSPLKADEGCGLVNCGLDHTLFHMLQVPVLVAIAVTSRRLSDTSPERSPTRRA